MSKVLFVQVDSQNKVIGPVGKEACSSGILHRSAAVLVFNKKGELLMQHRAKGLSVYPDMWTFSATGHVDWTENGPETYEQAAKREFKEELGKVLNSPLIDKGLSEVNAVGHHIMRKVFFTEDEGPFNPDPKEVQKVEFMSAEKIDKLLDKVTPTTKIVLKQLGLVNK